MATASELFEALSDELGKSFAAIEAYGLMLRKWGWWQKTKRGRGSTALTDSEACKLLLALMRGAPSDVPGEFTTYANLRLPPLAEKDPIHSVLLAALGLEYNTGFLDVMYAVLNAFCSGKANEIFMPKVRPGQAAVSDYRGPAVEFRIKSPAPEGIFEFVFTEEYARRAIELGASEASAHNTCRIHFLHQMYGWMYDAQLQGEQTDNYQSAIGQLLSEPRYSKGIGQEVSIGGSLIARVASVLSSP